MKQQIGEYFKMFGVDNNLNLVIVDYEYDGEGPDRKVVGYILDEQKPPCIINGELVVESAVVQ